MYVNVLCVPMYPGRRLKSPLGLSRLASVISPLICGAAILASSFFVSGCSSNEPLTAAQKARQVTVLRKQAEEQLAIFSASADDPEGVDFDALMKYVELHGETTKIAPGTCPLCFANYAEALSRLGLAYNTMVRAADQDLQSAEESDKPELAERRARYMKQMMDAFQNSNRQFNNYFMSCRSHGQPVDPERYRWALRNSEFLKDYNRALFYLDLYEANVTLSEEAIKNAERLRASYKREIERQEEDLLRQELDGA